jgi:hypothetical protein
MQALFLTASMLFEKGLLGPLVCWCKQLVKLPVQ